MGIGAKERAARLGIAEHTPQGPLSPFLLPHRVLEQTQRPSLAAALHTTLLPPQRQQLPVAEYVLGSSSTEFGQKLLPYLAPRPSRFRIGAILIQSLIQDPPVMLRDRHFVRILGDSVP